MSKRPADEDVCSFYLERKKRPCRMKKAKGMTYCPHHSHLGPNKDEKRGARIPCPYDSSHFCYESKLQKHLKKCNAREKEKPKYFVENINTRGVASGEEIKVGLNDLSDLDLLLLINKIKMIYNESNISVLQDFSLHPTVQEEMQNSSDVLNNFKHMRQQASLLSLMEQHGFLSDGSCFIELGAGKGQLMYWVVKCVPEKEKRTFLLIDRSAQRHKSDNKFKGTDIHIERIRVDIQHLHLGKMNSIVPNVGKVIGFSKHLCGCATDLALNCLTNTLEIDGESGKTQHRALGMVMALCCHHRCTWSSYVGQEFLKKKGISETDFKFMCCIASWATCGLRKRDSKKVDDHPNEVNAQNDPCDEEGVEDDVTHAAPVASDEALNRYIKLNLKHEEREEIGMQCKRLIDAGRIDCLEKCGYEVKLVTYIEKSVSLENVALIAIFKGS